MLQRRANQSGGPKAPRRPNGNIDWEVIRDDHLLPIIRTQRAPNTIRGIMYILKSKGILKKSDINGLDRYLVKWRLAGTKGWDEIADGSGRGLVGDFTDFQEPESWVASYKVFYLSLE